MEILKFVCLFSGIATGLISISYKDIAQKKGWQIGTLFFKTSSWLTILNFLIFIFATILSFKSLEWWQAILLIIASWLLSLIFIFSLKSFVQFLTIFLSLTFVILYIISFSARVS